MKMRALQTSVILAIVFLLSACTKRDQELSTQPAFGEYVFAYTSGVISVVDPVLVELAQPYSGKMNTDDLLPENLFAFEPKIKGRTVWQNATTLKFIPEGNLPPNTAFRGKLNLSLLYDDVPKEMKNFQFDFQTFKQNIKVYIDELQTPNAANMKHMQLNGKIFTADFINVQELNYAIRAHQGSRDLNISLVAESNRKYAFTITNIERFDEASEIEIKWHLGEKKEEISGGLTYAIPALGDFKVLSAKLKPGKEQEIIVNFSDPLADVKLDGIVKLEDAENIKFLIDGNSLHIFPQQKIMGNRQLTIDRSIKNAAQYEMGQDYSTNITFELEKPAVRFVSDKSIIPTQKQGLVFPFEAVSLKGVDIYITKIFSNNILRYLQESDFGESPYYMNRIGRHIYRKHINLSEMGATNIYSWNRYYVDLSDIITVDPGALYEVDIRFKQKDAAYGCNEKDEDEDVSTLKSGRQGWISDGTYYVDDYWADYVYNWEENENPCHPAYYSRWNSSTKRVVLATNLGVIAKMGGDKKLFVAVNDLRSAKPYQAASIAVYDYQLQLLGETLTDENGFATMNCAREPFAIIASSTSDKTYLKIAQSNNLSVSKFDVSGQNVQDGIKGFIYGERGVWRPGDSLYLNFILDDPNQLLPKSHPVEMKLYNPQEQLVKRIVKTNSVNGFYDFRTSTSPDAITGDYRMEVAVGNRNFSKNLKIETVKPNRLKIDFEFNKPKGKTLIGNLEARWLHGAVATNLKADVFMSLRGTKTTFKGFENYHFDNNIIDGLNTEETEVFNGTLNNEGKATLRIDMKDKVENAPGMLKVWLNTKVYEPGGNFSVDYHSIEYAPYETFAGMQLPESDLWGNALQTDKTQKIKLASVTKDGKLTDRKNLRVKMFKINQRWWYDQYDGAHYNYLNSSHYYEMRNELVPLSNGKGVFEINIPNNSWGSYLLHVEDPVSGHSSARLVYFDWPYWMRANRTGSDAESMLGFSSDKETYHTGDSIKLTFPSPENGRALVSIENGTKILEKHWVKTQKGVTKYAVKATADMSPNVYVHISLLQPHSQTQNDRPIRMYGVIPVMVEDPNSRLNPILSTPEVLKPESTAKITVSEKDGKPMTYTLAVVDEGLLSLTRFKTPNPWNSFYAREALGVKTWDMYNHVIGALNADIQSVLSIGGDEEAIDPGKQKAMRFKPVVRFLGPFNLEKGKKTTHEISIPNYIGAVRVMVVAGRNNAYGNTEKEIPVKSPVMVLGTLPRVLGPNEKVSLPVNVFAMEDQIKNVQINVETNGVIQIDGEKSKSVAFSKSGDQIIYFNLSTSKKTGIGKVKIEARSGNEVSRYEVELDVRASNPTYTTVQDKVILPGEEQTMDFTYFGVEGTNKAVLELSKLPALNLEKHLDFLINYPHGCLEQITSGVFPQIYLDKMIDLSSDQKIAIDNNVRYVLNAYRNYQLTSGGFSYWPGTGYADDWSTSYAGHFMLEAEKQGYALPIGLKSQWIRHQKNAARNYNSDENRDYPTMQRNQAYRLYTLALASQPDFGSMNVMLENYKLNISARWILALAYITAGQPEVGEQLIKGQRMDIPKYTELSYTYGSDLRDNGFVLQTLLKLNRKTDAAILANEMAQKLGKTNWFSTQELAFSLNSLALYMGNNRSDELKVSLSANGKSRDINTSRELIQEDLSANGNTGKVTIKNNGSENLFARLILTGQPIEGKEERIAKDLRMEIKYMDANHNPIDVENLKLGTNFIAEVKIINPGTRGDYENMALTQIFPPGWEILNPRMNDPALTGGVVPNYQDIRDDRVMSYFNINARESFTIRIQLNASYAGKFYMPAVIVNAMYDESIISVEPGKWIEVVK